MSRQVSSQYGKSNIIVIGQKIKEQCHTAAAGCGQLGKPVNITLVDINLRNSGDTYWSKQTTAMELKISEPSRLHTSHNQSRESSQCNGLRSKGGGGEGVRQPKWCSYTEYNLVQPAISSRTQLWSRLYGVQSIFGLEQQKYSTQYNLLRIAENKYSTPYITYMEQQQKSSTGYNLLGIAEMFYSLITCSEWPEAATRGVL